MKTFIALRINKEIHIFKVLIDHATLNIFANFCYLLQTVKVNLLHTLTSCLMFNHFAVNFRIFNSRNNFNRSTVLFKEKGQICLKGA